MNFLVMVKKTLKYTMLWKNSSNANVACFHCIILLFAEKPT